MRGQNTERPLPRTGFAQPNRERITRRRGRQGSKHEMLALAALRPEPRIEVSSDGLKREEVLAGRGTGACLACLVEGHPQNKDLRSAHPQTLFILHVLPPHRPSSIGEETMDRPTTLAGTQSPIRSPHFTALVRRRLGAPSPGNVGPWERPRRYGYRRRRAEGERGGKVRCAFL